MSDTPIDETPDFEHEYKDLLLHIKQTEINFKPLQILQLAWALLGFDRKTGQLSGDELVEEFYKIRRVKSIVDAREKQLSEVIKAKNQALMDSLTAEAPEAQISAGGTPRFTLVRVFQKRFDSEAVKLEMGADWYEAHCKSADFYQFKTIKE